MKAINTMFYVVFFCICCIIFFVGCSNGEKVSKEDNIINVVATTNMLSDLAKEIGGEKVDVKALMPPGIDPHLYQASSGDIWKMADCDVVIYNGLHLEGKMGKVFYNLNKYGKKSICIGDELDKELLIKVYEGGESIYDPHIWYDISLWKKAADITAKGLSEVSPENKDYFQENLSKYKKELDALDEYTKSRVNQLSKEEKILITAHDAFSYFGRAYGFEVLGIQGINTQSEASPGEIGAIARIIIENNVNAVFVETSISPKTINALMESVNSKDFKLKLGGSLYGDSLGDSETNCETYIKAFKYNVDTIVEALRHNI